MRCLACYARIAGRRSRISRWWLPVRCSCCGLELASLVDDSTGLDVFVSFCFEARLTVKRMSCVRVPELSGWCVVPA